MGFNIFNVKEDPANPSPPEIYNWKIYFVAICASFGSMMFGYDSAFIGGTLALPAFKDAFGLNNVSAEQKTALSAHIVSTFQAGCFFGAILVYVINEKFGRRISLITAGLVFNIGVIMQLCAPGKIGLLYAGRAFTGLGVGSSSLVIPQYIAECAPAAIRGGLVGLFEIALQVGSVCGYWVNYGVNKHVSPKSDSQWMIPVALQLVPASLMVIGMFFSIESPRHSVKEGNVAKAVRDLEWLRNLPADHPFITRTIENIEHQIEHENVVAGDGSTGFKAILKETFNRSVVPRLVIGCLLQIFQNTTGINGVNYFSPTIFKEIGFSGTSVGLLATGVYGVVKTIVASISFIFLVDRFGRRPLLLGASAGCIFTMYYLAGYSSLSHSFEGEAKQNAAGYSAVVMVYLFAVSYAAGWNLSWIVCSEIFPTQVRSFCLVFTTCAQWLGQFIIVYSTPYMMENITYGTFIFFGSMTVVAFIFIYILLPETKGVPLEEMDILWNDTRGLARTKRSQYDATKAAERDSVVQEMKNNVEYVENAV